MTKERISVPSHLPVWLLLLAICWHTTAAAFGNDTAKNAVAMPYLNAQLSITQRVQDLLSRMTLEEKVAQMCQYVGIEHIKAAEARMTKQQLVNNDAAAFYPGYTPADIERMVEKGMIGSFLHVVTLKEANHLQELAKKSRLKIPLLIGIDAIHGNGMVSGCTIYPSPIGMAASWDTATVKQIARYTAKEMRATGSQWAFSPNLDIARDARWGRVGETFGEDPFLVTAMGVSMIQGLQGNLDSKDNVIACAKHLIAGSVPINGLNVAPTDISERTLNEIYLPPYRSAVDAGVFTVMPAHNEVNGIACHANKFLMTDLLRSKWNYKGFYISDFMDIERLALVHKIAVDQKDAVYKTITAGMDMHMHGPGFLEPVLELINEKKLSESRINESVSKILEAKFRLGLFENNQVPEADVSKTVYTQEHTDASLAIAEKSLVLLKNENVLPLSNRYKRILVTGPNANCQALLGDWSLQQPDDHITTVLKGLQAASPKGITIAFADVGSSTVSIPSEKINAAVQKAATADITIVVVGENALRFAGKDRTSGENVDRDNTDLLGNQLELVQQLYKSGKPVVVVLINGRPLSIPWINEKIPAILEAWEPGGSGGKAIAEVLFGTVNPSGKLPISFPQNVGQVPVFYNRKPSQYVRNYLSSVTKPLYEFGYGLSYTTFSYSDMIVERKEYQPGESITAQITITNTGSRQGEEVVQLYITQPVNGITHPIKELKGFRRLSLQPGEKQVISFNITPEMLMSYDEHMVQQISKGTYGIMTGGSSVDADLKKAYFSVQ